MIARVICRDCNKPKANATAGCTNPHCKRSVSWGNPNSRSKEVRDSKLKIELVLKNESKN